jgi:hypothetical protein
MIIETYYEEENDLIIINKLNDNELEIKLANQDKNHNINFAYTYKIIIYEDNFSLICISESTNLFNENELNGWTSLRTCLLETHWNEVSNLIIQNYKKEDWIKILIKIFPEISFYKIDDTHEQSGLHWLKNIIFQI